MPLERRELESPLIGERIPMRASSHVAERHDIERAWHEAHGHVGQEENANRYKGLVLELVRTRQLELLGDVTGKSLLEVGCGVGTETVAFAERGAQVVGVDLAPSLVETARQRAHSLGLKDRVQFIVSPAEDLVAKGHRFDIVCGNGILHHLDLALFKTALRRLLKPGGTAQFHEPLVHHPLLRLYRVLTPNERTPTERPLSVEGIRSFTHGFASVHLEFFNLLGLFLLPAPYVFGNGVSRRILALTHRLDEQLLARLPALRRFCQYVVIQVRAPL